MKRTLASATAAMLILATLTGCSAYNNPGKYVTLPALTDLKIKQSDIDSDLKEQIDAILEDNRKADYQTVTEAAKLGDQVTIDYEGKPTDPDLQLSDDTLARMKAEGADLVLGSDSFITAYTDSDGKETHKGFEDQLIGKKAGDKVDVLVKFPDDYDTIILQGVEVNFSVTVNTVSRLTVDDDTLVEIDYAFTAPTLDSPKEDSTTEEGSGSNAQSDASATTASSSTSSPELEDDEDDKAVFTDLFKAGSFTIDYAEDADDSKFNTIFKVADYRDLFKGASLYQEIKQEVKIPDDVEDTFKDYAGETITITFTVCSATILPEWTDELVKEVTSEAYTTTAAYEEAMLTDIKINLALEAAEAAAVYDGYPKKEAKKLYEQYVEQAVESTLGDDLENLSASDLKGAISDEEYEEIYAAAAAQSIATVKSRLLIELLCDELDVKLSNKEYKEELEKTFADYQADTTMMYYYSQYYGTIFTDAEQLETYFGKDSLELQFKTNKMADELVKKVQIVE